MRQLHISIHENHRLKPKGQQKCELGNITENPYQLVKLMEDVICASTSSLQCLAVTGDGSLWFWGTGHIPGDNLKSGSSELIGVERRKRVKIMDDVIYAQAYGYGGYAVKSDYSLWEWGLGSPDLVKIMDDVAYVETGSFYTLIVKNDGTLWQSGSMEGFKKEYAKPYKIGEDIWMPEK